MEKYSMFTTHLLLPVTIIAPYTFEFPSDAMFLHPEEVSLAIFVCICTATDNEFS